VRNGQSVLHIGATSIRGRGAAIAVT